MNVGSPAPCGTRPAGRTWRIIIALVALLMMVVPGWLLLAPSAQPTAIEGDWEPERRPMPPADVALSYYSLSLAADQFAPLRLVGAWVVHASDPRFGGISALAIDGAALLAMSDAGVMIRLARPGTPAPRVHLQELPAGPGSPFVKQDRDTEALARDPLGRGWWVSFENHNELWLFDRSFSRALDRRKIEDPAFYYNHGIEALAACGTGLVAIPEAGRVARIFDGHVSEAAALPGGSMAVLVRRTGRRDILRHWGLDNRLLLLRASGNGFDSSVLGRLPLGPFDNVEAMAAEAAQGGAVRIWLMTDNDQVFWRSTLLLELEIDLDKVGAAPPSC